MRHMMFGGGFVHGFGAFMLFRMMHRMVSLLVFAAVIAVVILLWARSRRPPPGRW